MTDDIDKVIAGLTKADKALFMNARQYPSGFWLGGPCKHLYADYLCRLTGEVTERGLAVRQRLIEQGEG